LTTQASNEDVGSDVPDTGDGVPDLGNGVDMETFSQILEMDDDGDRSFSKSLFVDFVAQAAETFTKIEESLYVTLSRICVLPFSLVVSPWINVYNYPRSRATTDVGWHHLRAKSDLKALSEQGHYLKGSSATLGLSKVQDSCEKIQRYGKKENADSTPEPNEDLCLQRIRDTLVVLRADYDDVARELRRFYSINEDMDENEDDSGEESAENDASSNKGTTKDSGNT
jgi:osomolarity two-component system phosphorelay intermediate protein YPD1